MMKPGLLISAGAFLLCSCSIFAGHEQMLRVSAAPQDAKIIIDDQIRGNPVEMSVPRDKEIRIRVEKEGYYPYETFTRKTLSGLGIGDAIATGFLLVPAFGLLSPGAWELMQTDFNVVLVKIPERRIE